MKRVVSVSIGSSLRDRRVETEFLGQEYTIERIGTNGNIAKAIETIRDLDGKVDAFGMGGIDLYITSGSKKRYVIREAEIIRRAARLTPIVDGSGMKNTLEVKVVEYINENGIVDLKGKKVLLTCAADRFRMAETFVGFGCSVVIGDLMFVLGLPLPINSLRTFRAIADMCIPAVSKLPFGMLYPTGEKQKDINTGRFSKFYSEADIIAGDYHYIKKFMPEDMEGKIIVTNTVTPDDVDMLRRRGVSTLVTTTPSFGGRSFGTNVMEALLISASGKRPEELTEGEYYSMIERLSLKPRVEQLN